MKQNLSESHPCSWCQSKAEAQMLPLDTAFWSQAPAGHNHSHYSLSPSPVQGNHFLKLERNPSLSFVASMQELAKGLTG